MSVRPKICFFLCPLPHNVCVSPSPTPRNLGHWNNGTLGHWDTVTLGHRNTETPIYWTMGLGAGAHIMQLCCDSYFTSKYINSGLNSIIVEAGHLFTACNAALSGNTHHLLESKMAVWIWKLVKPRVIGPSDLLSLQISWFDYSFYKNLKNTKWPTGSWFL